jgi:uncharacterized damage-inducible protein DinB
MERVDPALQADERTTLAAFLDYQRATFLSKIAGLTHEQLNQALPPSDLTLASLTKHLALVEDSWFQERFVGVEVEPWASAPFDDDRDWEMHSAKTDTVDELIALYRAAVARSQATLARVDSLDTLSAVNDGREGIPYSIRWILVHMIEETARHNGHADLIRQSIDGLIGE